MILCSFFVAKRKLYTHYFCMHDRPCELNITIIVYGLDVAGTVYLDIILYQSVSYAQSDLHTILQYT